ncbi:queuosine 5'-phosphate N-glycosylase/hydrolase-like isoform X1 [Platichthys flesus]|uniref:queuosine 5'-phosphate N-glycosylase/hydrolase-like isoform X1 n=1 Tax=Platichthys flesus TaxID=8260 RepID=UPI002DB7458C|nr:queuosine 5'-phosphate N-glycosylase/hydrolase-like isoform X1 [Platichthys flesus]
MDWRSLTQVRELGMVVYNCSCLAEDLSELLCSGDRREVEIPGCSVWSVELIKDQLCKLVQERDGETCHINSTIMDFYNVTDVHTNGLLSICNGNRTSDLPVERVEPTGVSGDRNIITKQRWHTPRRNLQVGDIVMDADVLLPRGD